MKEIGAITRCTDTEYSPGVMVENTKENMLMTKKKEREDLYGLMEESTLEAGRMENNTAMENILTKRETPEKVYGRTDREFNGSRNIANNDSISRFI